MKRGVYMTFELGSVVPWGRSFEEYIRMFSLKGSDLDKKIIGFGDGAFDLGLSSHFLVLYSQLGLQFHIDALSEMMRICQEIRIFPLRSLDATQSEILAPLLTFLQQHFYTEIVPVDYEFQKGANSMLVISHMNA